jgi:alpha-1,3-rhamnosyl/mannosyltransferase
VIAGAWDTRYPEVKMQVQALGLERRILFRHEVSNQDLPGLISGARVFVFPSLHEGFGLPPLEAMACGAPVACANTSSLPEVVGDAAVLFDPRDESSIVNALTRVLHDSSVRETLRTKGLVQARQFSWERTARETLDVYRKVSENTGVRVESGK